MNSINDKIPCIRVNDIFDELIDENQRLKQCLNVFIKFKTFVDFISTKIANNLETNEFQKLKVLTQNVEEVVNNCTKDFDMNSNFNNIMKTPEKTGKEEIPEEVIKTENTPKSVTDINTSEKISIPTKKKLNKSDEKIIREPEKVIRTENTLKSVFSKFQENIGMKSNFNNVMKTPEKDTTFKILLLKITQNLLKNREKSRSDTN